MLLDDPKWDRIAALGSEDHATRLVTPDQANEDPLWAPATVRLPPPPRHGRPPKGWDSEAALDLWLHVPAGYKRDGRGRWRYIATGLPVPGARDITLASLYSFPVADDVMLVPVSLARSADELAWCRRVEVGERTVVLDGRAQQVLEVPITEWSARCHAPLGLVAPELAPERLLDLQAVASLAGISYRTAVSYFCRRGEVPPAYRFPEPVARLAGTPVWSDPVVRAWLAARPGHANGGNTTPRHRRRRGG